LGGGTVQPFNKTILAWTQKAGVYPMYAGKEYIALYQLLSKLQADYKAAQSQITSLQQQVKQLQEQQPTPQPASNIDVNEAISIINAVEVALANLKQELGK
jgi:hypothetical protein